MRGKKLDTQSIDKSFRENSYEYECMCHEYECVGKGVEG